MKRTENWSPKGFYVTNHIQYTAIGVYHTRDSSQVLSTAAL